MSSGNGSSFAVMMMLKSRRRMSMPSAHPAARTAQVVSGSGSRAAFGGQSGLKRVRNPSSASQDGAAGVESVRGYEGWRVFALVTNGGLVTVLEWGSRNGKRMLVEKIWHHFAIIDKLAREARRSGPIPGASRGVERSFDGRSDKAEFAMRRAANSKGYQQKARLDALIGRLDAAAKRDGSGREEERADGAL
ncbi:uncharacterized protein BDZ99DRAFT_539261 [Mytilinidion resinicola]|uniref:Uncharacterized protein n=1 Tax=Mytilinidion resinicola TaxID=574789 RepID=A0A6A6YCZ6_9PEZI|nr:uncharacterized protein BDZ99DRAFT_539261 [Mytilinidion resinicola]KAF2805965.1 hypothetical protein BDZ99DRAFT_539261 [Mytilinidion resinicola]